ncbi:MAG TPA: pilus assembly protein TadG-related protein [Candidatus Sulfotelmatobacter sp.]
MRAPAIRRFRSARYGERGITMVLVAVALVAIVAMAALSIDVVTLYLAREEAQRTADTAALGAARVLSLSGVTGDPQNATGYWPVACTAATQVARALANQDAVGNTTATSVNVNFLYNGTAVANCSFTGANAVGVNPQVQVKIVRGGLPTFFSRIWSRNTNSSATATAEAFNSSGSETFAPNGIVPVNPRCVKPWIVPNRDPNNSGAPFVKLADGSIQNPGIQLDPGTGTGAVIGEKFAFLADCLTGNPNCRHGQGFGLINNPPTYNRQGAGTLDYVPALIGGTAGAVPACATGSAYQAAIAGCDQSTVYACGIVGGGAQADLTFNPGKASGDTATATQCLIHQTAGQDVLDSTAFPFRIQAGLGNPVITNAQITSSNSIVSVPIYDDTQGTTNPVAFTVDQPPVTIVGFLQVFINSLDTTNGNINVTVLNVAGCSNTATASTPTVTGSSPVPIRLITPP